MLKKMRSMSFKHFCLLSFGLLISAALMMGPGATSAQAAKKAATQKAVTGLVDINNASQKELEALPGVGAASAKKIIASRPYKSADDLSKAGLSAKVVDKIKPLVTVGAASSAASTAVTTAAKAKADTKTQKAIGGLVDINNASQKELEALPGVGAATAKKIVAGRPYKSTDDLSKAGLSAKVIDKIKPLVTVGTASAAASTAVTTTAATVADSKPVKEVKTASKSAATKLAPGTKININTADKATLESLPAIGPVKAQAIIDGRPYKSVEDIMKIKGIKQKTFDAIKDYLVL
jgi:competence protein ComEA